MQASTVLALLSFVIVLILHRMHKASIARRSLPPGPKPFPLVGNINDIPLEHGQLKYAELAKQHGDMLYLEALGIPMLIISSFRRANDLLEKRSSNYSCRPASTMILELMGWGFNVGLIPYGDAWRRRRRLLHNYFHPNAKEDHHPIQLQATQALLKDLLQESSEFLEHLRKHAGTIILKSVYGYDVKGHHDPLVLLADAGLATLNKSTEGGLYLVDIIPALKYVPAWFPGAEFKRFANYANEVVTRMATEPFESVKAQLAAKTAQPCFTEKYLTEMQVKKDLPADQELVVQESSAIAYAAGADTTASTLSTFFLAMALNPEVQKKAQAQIDLAIGNDRLPNFSDQTELPYIHAILQETMRWHPVLPMGVTHRCIAEDFYDGYRIPAGTLVMPNVWAMTRDESVYPEPEKFIPDRFIVEEWQQAPIDPISIGFGFGRRICVGRYLALETTWIAMAQILAAFTIEKEIDSSGKEIEPLIEYTPGLLTYPKPFKCRIVPRSEKAAQLIKA